MFTVHIIINRTSWNVILDYRSHLLSLSSFIWCNTPPRPTSTVIVGSRSLKSYVFFTIDLSSDHWTSSDKAKAQHLFLGPLSLQAARQNSILTQIQKNMYTIVLSHWISQYLKSNTYELENWNAFKTNPLKIKNKKSLSLNAFTNLRLCLVTIFVFYFHKLVFW